MTLVDDTFQRTEQLLLQEMPDVLSQTGMHVSRTVRRGPGGFGRCVLGTIGFGGPHMRGSIALLAPIQVWERSVPAELGPPPVSEMLLADFVGELCNLLSGRFRHRLLRFGVEALFSTPTAIGGTNIEMPRVLAASSAWYELSTSVGLVHARYDVTFEETFVFDDSHEPIQPIDTNLVLF
jgi:hypothetical protein